MAHSLFSTALALLAVPFNVSSAADYRYQDYNLPDLPDTLPHVIADSGAIIGSGSQDGLPLLYVNSGTNLVRFHAPTNFSEVSAFGANSRGIVVGQLDFAVGFTFDGVAWTEVAHPALDATETFLTGINGAGHITGTYFGDLGARAFLLTNGVFVDLHPPDASRSFAYGINDQGVICGHFRAADGITYGFLQNGAQRSIVRFPGADATQCYGINQYGHVAGPFRHPETGTRLRGFVFDGTGYQELAFPEADWTVPLDINDAGVVVGYYRDTNAVTRGFVATPIVPQQAMQVVELAVPGGENTVVAGVNNLGLIAGNYTLGDDPSLRGFFFDGRTYTPFPTPEGHADLDTYGLNDTGILVGEIDFTSGFVRESTNFAVLDYPDPAVFETVFQGIDNRGNIVGYGFGDEGSFAFRHDGTNFARLELPDAVRFSARGINEGGQIVGGLTEQELLPGVTNLLARAFTLAEADLLRFAAPEATTMLAFDNNDVEEVVGIFRHPSTGTAQRGFLRRGGQLTELSISGANRVIPFSINNAGLVVGVFGAPGAMLRAFIVVPGALLDERHADIGFDFSVSDGWNPHVHDHDTETEYEPREAVLAVNEMARQPVPMDPRFAFLGTPGAPVWILPQSHKEGLLDLGLGTEGIEAGVLRDDEVRLELSRFRAPGEFFLYLVDGFGVPTVFFDTRDGIGATDVHTLMAGSHVHMNWAFTQPGLYAVELQARAALADGTPTLSEPRTYFFLVTGTTNPAPALILSRVSSSVLEVAWPSYTGNTYHLEASSTVTGPWVEDGASVAGTGTIVRRQVNVLDGMKFFRVRAVPAP